MSGSVVVDANGTILQIKMNNGTKKLEVELSKLFNTFKERLKNPSDKLHAKMTNFATLNIGINHGDSIKDGTNAGELANFNLFQDVPFTLSQLKDLAHTVIDQLKKNQIILRQVFTRDKKGDTSILEHYKGMDFDIGFDAGLGLDNFLELKQYDLYETFGKYIDPSSFREVSKCFPEKNVPLSITTNAFARIGYHECHLENAICNNPKSEQYSYSLTLGSNQSEMAKTLSNPAKPTDKPKERKTDANIQTIFVGNNAKKSIKDPAVKHASIIGKGLGDKLQVFIMYVKSLVDSKDRVTCISTCDEIVLLFCIILGLPCFYTSVGVEKGLKINEILYFNLDNTNADKARKRLTNETNVVMKGYNELIKLIRGMNSTTIVYVSGDTKPYQFTKAFYDGLIADLERIITDVENTSNDGRNGEIDEVNRTIGAIQTMAVNNFIRKNGNDQYMLIRTANKYNSGTAINKFGEPKYKSATFLYIGTEMNKQTEPGKSSGGYKMLGGNKPDELSFFDDTPVVTEIYSDTIVFKNYKGKEEQEKDEDKKAPKYSVDKTLVKFDAREALYSQIHTLLGKNAQRLFSDVLSELLRIFNYDPSYDDEHISKHIASILEDIRTQSNAEEKRLALKVAWASPSKSRKRPRSPGSLSQRASVSNRIAKRSTVSRHGKKFPSRTQSAKLLKPRSSNHLRNSHKQKKRRSLVFNSNNDMMHF